MHVEAGVRAHLRDGRACRFVVDDRSPLDAGGDERLAGQVVDRPGEPPRRLVDPGYGVVGEKRVSQQGYRHVVLYVPRRLLRAHRGEGVAERHALVEGGETAQAEARPM